MPKVSEDVRKKVIEFLSDKDICILDEGRGKTLSMLPRLNIMAALLSEQITSTVINNKDAQGLVNLWYGVLRRFMVLNSALVNVSAQGTELEKIYGEIAFQSWRH
jgi:hypothetical protein